MKKETDMEQFIATGEAVADYVRHLEARP